MLRDAVAVAVAVLAPENGGPVAVTVDVSSNTDRNDHPTGEEAKSRPTQPRAVKEYERKQLLERVGREAATIGADIPEEIEVQGEPLELRQFVFEIKRRDTVPAEERERVDDAKRNLRRERNERLERIEEGEISFAEGERLAASIIGIDRALNALEQLDPVDLESEAARQEAADQKRWMNFLQQALGHDDDGSQRRGSL
jgi:hypothetical protein